MIKTWRISCIEFSPVVRSIQVTRSSCIAPSKSDDLGPVMHLDCGIFRNALDQIARHGLRQVPERTSMMHVARGLGQEHSSLSGGVASTDDYNILVFAELRFDVRRAVINSLAFELLEIGEMRLVVLRAGGDDDGARRQLLPLSRTTL